MAFVYLRKHNETEWIGVEQVSNSKSKRYFIFKNDELEKVKEILRAEGHGYHEEGKEPHLVHTHRHFIIFMVVVAVLLLTTAILLLAHIKYWILVQLGIALIMGLILQLQLKYSDTKKIKHDFQCKSLTNVPFKRIFSYIKNDYDTNNYTFLMLFVVLYTSTIFIGIITTLTYVLMMYIISFVIMYCSRLIIYKYYEYRIYAPVFKNTDLRKIVNVK